MSVRGSFLENFDHSRLNFVMQLLGSDFGDVKPDLDNLSQEGGAINAELAGERAFDDVSLK